MPPITVLIKPTSSLCNMKCKYCFYHDVAENREHKSYGRMSEQTLEVLVEKALKYADGMCTFAFQGGEPTLAGLDFYKKLIEFEKKYNVKRLQVHNAIQTNGYNIDEEYAKFLADHKFLVGLSLDGTRELHDSLRIDINGYGTYDRVINAAKLFDRAGVEYNILCVVNNYVARHGTQVYNLFKKMGFRFLQFIQCLDGFDGEKKKFSLTPERYSTFLKSTFDCYYNDFMDGDYTSVRMFDNYVRMVSGLPAESCGMNGVCSCNFVVEGDGSVFPCDFYVLDEYRLGNIKENSFEEMSGGAVARRFVEMSEYIDPQCRECKWLNICRGGCRRNREPFVEGRPSLNEFCQSYYDFFEYAYARIQKMAVLVKQRG